MLKSLYTSATGMKTQQVMVDTIANNIANVNTAGFKRSQATFEDLLYVTVTSPGLQRNSTDTPNPIGLQVGSGSRLSGTTKIHSPGTLEVTNRNLDLAIDGDGFFQVQLPDGSVGYTRDGHLHLNANGRLVTSAGYELLPQLRIPSDLEALAIDVEGRVTIRQPGSEATVPAGQIQLVRFINPSGMEAIGGNVLRATEAAGTPREGVPGAEGTGFIKQGHIERSNVEIVNELVSLIVAQRAYEVNSRSIQASDQMLSTATTIIR